MATILQNHSKYLFLIDHHCKTQSEMIGNIENSQNWSIFLQGEIESIQHDFKKVLMVHTRSQIMT